MIYAKTDKEPSDEFLNRHLFFSLKDNGENDLLFVGTKYGGAFPPMSFFGGNEDITIQLSADAGATDGISGDSDKSEQKPVTVIWTGKIHGGLLYEGVVIELGDIVRKEQIDKMREVYGRKIFVSKMSVQLK